MEEMTPEEKLKRIAEIKYQMLQLKQLQATEKASKDFCYFLDKFVYTHDEHDPIEPTKKFPMKDYIKQLAKIFVTEEKIIIEKSRQMMVSWIACAYALWIAMFHDGRRVFIQSKKEKDANELLNRCKFIYDKLPEVTKNKYKQDPPAHCKMTWGKANSNIQAIPQGADVLRQYTSSLIISDEMAFQEKSEEAYIAAKPTLVGGGQFIGISSPNFKEFFYRCAHDLMSADNTLNMLYEK